MARFGIVRDGVIENVVEAEHEASCAHLRPVVLLPLEVGPGWQYDGTEFTEPETQTE